MPRVKVTERQPALYYDTIKIGPGQRNRQVFAEAKRVGSRLTNLQMPGQFIGGQFIMLVFGVRVVDAADDAEAARVLDHIHLVFESGDHPVLDFYGPQPIMTAENPVGFKLPRPIVVPHRQSVCLRVRADSWLPKAYVLRFHIGGLQDRA
jgi:hypothetical protein